MIHEDALIYVNDLVKSEEVKQSENTKEKKEEEEQKLDEKQKTERTGVYDMIVIDINDSSAGSKLSPPRDFLSEEYLKRLKQLLTESGVLMINIIPSESAILDNCLKDINKVFDVIYVAKPETEANYVAYMLNIDLKRDQSHDGTELLIVEADKIPSKKELETAFKSMVKTLGVKWDSTMNLDQYCGEIVLKYPLLKNNPFQLTNVHLSKGEGEYTNKTKEMYLEDKEKVTKSQRKKKKNKKR